MKNLFVSYEIAKQLKEKGFDETCIAISNGERIFYGEFHNKHAYYERGLILFQQVIDWFREKQNIRIVDSLNPNTVSSRNLANDFHFHAIRLEGGGGCTKDLKWGNGRSEYKWHEDYYQSLESTIHELLNRKDLK